MKPSTMVAGRWKSFAVVSYEIGGSRLAFMIDPLKPAVGVVHLTFGFDACWYDELQDDLIILQGGNVKRFNDGASNLNASFESKVYRQPSPQNYGYCKVVASGYPLSMTIKSDVYNPVTNTTSTRSTTKQVTGPNAFALPSGFASNDWQVSIDSSAFNVQGVRLTTKANLLKG
jgi:hypothetical protein